MYWQKVMLAHKLKRSKLNKLWTLSDMIVFKTVPQEHRGTLLKKGGGGGGDLHSLIAWLQWFGISVSLPAVGIVCVFSWQNMFLHVIGDKLTFVPTELPQPCSISLFIVTRYEERAGPDTSRSICSHQHRVAGWTLRNVGMEFGGLHSVLFN